MPLRFEIDGDSVEALIGALAPTEKQFEAALRSTYGKMARWLRTKSVRGLSSKLRIQQKILRGRVRTYRLQGGIMDKGAGAKVWYGLKDIPFSQLSPKKTATGVKAAGGRHRDGAFIATIRGRKQVMERIGRARVPLRTVYAEISEESQVYIEDQLIGTTEFDMQYFKFLEHELRWRTRIL